MCSRKCATPEVDVVSEREPASIQTPTVAVWAYGDDSVATVSPLGRVEIWVSGSALAVARLRRNEGACRGGTTARVSYRARVRPGPPATARGRRAEQTPNEATSPARARPLAASSAWPATPTAAPQELHELRSAAASRPAACAPGIWLDPIGRQAVRLLELARRVKGGLTERLATRRIRVEASIFGRRGTEDRGAWARIAGGEQSEGAGTHHAESNSRRNRVTSTDRFLWITGRRFSKTATVPVKQGRKSSGVGVFHNSACGRSSTLALRSEAALDDDAAKEVGVLERGIVVREVARGECRLERVARRGLAGVGPAHLGSVSASTDGRSARTGRRTH